MDEISDRFDIKGVMQMGVESSAGRGTNHSQALVLVGLEIEAV
jgi:hypothetical protein